jgi:transposase-like protein
VPGKTPHRRPRGSKGKPPPGKAAPPEVRRRAVELCAAGRRSSEIAAELGLSERTIRDWRTQPEFDDEVQALDREIREAAVAKLKSLACKAVATLEALLDRADEAPTQRGAAKDILSLIGLDPEKQIAVRVSRGVDTRRLSQAELEELDALLAKADPEGSGGSEG